jgi:hypothetical protein
MIKESFLATHRKKKYTFLFFENLTTFQAITIAASYKNTPSPLAKESSPLRESPKKRVSYQAAVRSPILTYKAKSPGKIDEAKNFSHRLNFYFRKPGQMNPFRIVIQLLQTMTRMMKLKKA